MNILTILTIFFVGFSDKAGSTTPALSPTAIQMRLSHNIAIDLLDYPVSTAYLNQVTNTGATVMHTSRWFNGATVSATYVQIQAISNLPFVVSVDTTRDNSASLGYGIRKRIPASTEDIDYGMAQSQLEAYNLPPLHALGYEGQNIRMAVCDVGFTNANNIAWIDSAHYLGHYDFTDDTDDFYGKTGTHGTRCLSYIVGKTDMYHGAAVKTEYYLMRSEEYDTESPKEIDNWVAAIETADSLGVHIFSSSLGYFEFDNPRWSLTYSQMNGVSTRASRAATIASRKGMLVCVAAGNEADNSWYYITAPSDADSILCVGAVYNNNKHEVTSFSSRGPSYDGRIKPDVCAVGGNAYFIYEGDGTSIYSGNGTSFATPLLAGMAACLWSAYPEESGMQIRERILNSADRRNNPDNDYGYGIPNALVAYNMHSTDVENSYVQKESRPTKRIVNGQLIIEVNGVNYTILGYRK